MPRTLATQHVSSWLELSKSQEERLSLAGLSGAFAQEGVILAITLTSEIDLCLASSDRLTTHRFRNILLLGLKSLIPNQRGVKLPSRIT